MAAAAGTPAVPTTATVTTTAAGSGGSSASSSSPPVAIVTGGAQGIGRAISTQLLGAGYRVVVADIDAEAGADFLKTLTSKADRDRCTFIQTDVSKESQIKALIDGTVRAYGNRIDAIVNNAAIARATYGADPHTAAHDSSAAASDSKSANADAAPKPHPLETLSLETFNQYLAVNVTSVFLIAKYGLPYLKRSQPNGAPPTAGSPLSTSAIVNISSTRALQSEPFTEPYSTTKGAVLALTHSLAVSLGSERVRVNCVSPGWIDVSSLQKTSSAIKPAVLTATDHSQHPVGRVGVGSDISELVLFLCDGSKSGFITGQNFVVDGGMTKKMIYT